MTVSIIGSNGMLSTFLSKFFKEEQNNQLHVYGIVQPKNYNFDSFTYTDLLKDEIDYNLLIQSDLIVYASGAGVEAALQTKAELMYQLNLFVPINICNKLKELEYKGKFISFGSYMEIGINSNENIQFDEKQIETSDLAVSNDYALSKRLLTRFVGNLIAPYQYWHFILPNLFVKNETGTRLIPYVLGYVNKIKSGNSTDMPSFSSGTQLRQYINLDDLCLVIKKSIECNIKSGIYNVGGGEILTIRELITRLFNFYQIDVTDEMFNKEVRRDGDIKSLKISGIKLMNEIGYLPHQKIESIL
ncbi:MAG: NAD(P)-dependent oxidoreductase [Bacteroidales bacterium]|nr:NAD(P)-dependent oxidoreductase [Bacteroidales bacterium]